VLDRAGPDIDAPTVDEETALQVATTVRDETSGIDV